MDTWFTLVKELFNPLSLSLILLMLAVWLSQTVQAATGFGGTVIAVALGANFYPLDTLVPVVVAVNIFMSIYLVWRHGKTIDWPILLKKILPFMFLGMPLGLIIFLLGPVEALEAIFGIFVVLVGLFEFFRTLSSHSYSNMANPPVPLKPWAASLWLLSAGIVHGIYASGGPLVVYFASRQFSYKAVFRSTLSMLWLIVTGILFIGYSLGERVTAETASMTFILLPFLFLGALTGEYIHARVNEKAFRLLVYLLLVVAGFSLAWGS
ncbi:MAG: sulfite exporter TauE/SafE family protein [Bacillota bacterium]